MPRPEGWVRIKPVKTLEKDSEGSLFQAEGRVGIKPHSGVAELGAWPVVQQVWTVFNLAWGRHFCTAHQIGSQPVSELLCFLTGVSETRGPECILPNSLLSEPQSPARTSPGTCFNLESALEVMLRVKRSPCRFWCPGWAQSSVQPWPKCCHIPVPWPDSDTWKRWTARRSPAHVPESQHHKQQNGSFFKALTFG